MNIVNLHTNNFPGATKNLFAHMKQSLENSGASLEKSVRLAKTIAPILQDQSSNERHINIIKSDASTQEKVIAIIMLGFPKNRPVLPFLQELLYSSSESIAMAATIAIAQMNDHTNSQLLSDIFLKAFHASTSETLKKSIKQALLNILDPQSARLIKDLI